MLRILIGVLCTLYAANAAPQFVTFKDGKIGVNFGGYHAEAGLGGLLTGDATHGGLSASAGTPWGPQAAAGLGGQVDGRTAGVAYAGAQANPAVGASAVLGGNVAGREGFIGSEAHANGKLYSNMHTANQIAKTQSQAYAAAPVTSAPSSEQTNYVQKIKPPKKYTLIKSERVVSVSDGNDGSDDENVAALRPLAAAAPAASSPNNGNANGGTVDTAVVFVKERERRQRKRNKRPRSHVRVAYVLQQQQQEPQMPQQQQPQQQQQQPQQESAVQAPKQQTTFQEPNDTTGATKIVHSKKVVKSVERPAYVPSPVAPVPTAVDGQVYVQSKAQPNVVFNALNIPIGILRSLQESLGGLGAH